MSEPMYDLTIYRNLIGEKYSGPYGPVRVLAPHKRTLLGRGGALRRLDLPWVALGEVLRFGRDQEQLFVGFKEDPRDGERHAMCLHVWHGGRFVGHVCLGSGGGGDVWSTAWSDDSLGLTAYGVVQHHSVFVPTSWHATLTRRSET